MSSKWDTSGKLKILIIYLYWCNVHVWVGWSI